MKYSNYNDLSAAADVTDEIIKVYKQMARHERYLEEKDRTNKNVSFGYEDEIVHLLPRRLLEPAITPETKLLLNEALNALKCKNKMCYDAVMDYYINCYGITYEQLGKKYKISAQASFFRVKKGLKFLNNYMNVTNAEQYCILGLCILNKK